MKIECDVNVWVFWGEVALYVPVVYCNYLKLTLRQLCVNSWIMLYFLWLLIKFENVVVKESNKIKCCWNFSDYFGHEVGGIMVIWPLKIPQLEINTLECKGLSGPVISKRCKGTDRTLHSSSTFHPFPLMGLSAVNPSWEPDHPGQITSAVVVAVAELMYIEGKKMVTLGFTMVI